MPIYTKTGDKGETSLFGGKRVAKSDPQVDAYGAIDELNSWVGLLVSEIKVSEWREFLQQIQTDLLTIGSTLAGWKGDLSLLPKRVKEMEKRIDQMEKELPALKNFILPGGGVLGSHIHITRSVCRRVERRLVALKLEVASTGEAALFFDPSADGEKFNDSSLPTKSGSNNNDLSRMIIYLNRLSDLFFMLARFINNMQGVSETKWSGKSNDLKLHQ